MALEPDLQADDSPSDSDSGPPSPSSLPRAVQFDSSDDDEPSMGDAPRFVKGHATYGDAEFFCRKASRLLRSGKYAKYDLRSQLSQLSTYCDDATAVRLDKLHGLGGVGHPIIKPWVRVLPAPEQPENLAAGLPFVAEVVEQPAAELEDLMNWFIHHFSKGDVVKAAKRRLQSSFGQTTTLDTHLDQIERDVATVRGSLTDNSQVDNILASLSPSCVDEMVGYKGLGSLARDHMENPKTKSDFDTGDSTIEWLIQQEHAYITAADAVGASQYWVGFKDRKLQTHPKRVPKGVHAIVEDPSPRMKQMENRQDKIEAHLLDVQQTQLESKTELTTLSTTVTTWHADSDRKQDEMLAMMRKGGGRASKGDRGKGAGSQQHYGGGNYGRQATMYGKGGGTSYGNGKYGQDWNSNRSYQPGKGGQGGQSGTQQPWMTKPRQAPAHIECWNCGKNHFAFQCTAPPDVRDPNVQAKVNAIDSSLRGDGPHATQDIIQQFESVDSATQWVNHVRSSTEEMVRTDFANFGVISPWPCSQVRIAAVQQQQQDQQYSEYSQASMQNVNATSNGACPVSQGSELTRDSQVGTAEWNEPTGTATIEPLAGTA